MNDDALRCTDTERQRAQSLLGEALSRGQLELHEFDARVQQCIAAATRGDLVALFDDLVLDPRQVLFPMSGRQPGHSPAIADWNADGLLGSHHGFAEIAAAEASGRASWQVEKQKSRWQKFKDSMSAENLRKQRSATYTEVAFGSNHRTNWTIGANHSVGLWFGSVTLDLRTARFSAMHTSIRVVAWGGKVKIVIPQGVRLDCSSVTISTGLKERIEPGAAHPAYLSPHAPLVSIHNESAFTSVEVIVTAH